MPYWRRKGLNRSTETSPETMRIASASKVSISSTTAGGMGSVLIGTVLSGVRLIDELKCGTSRTALARVLVAARLILPHLWLRAHGVPLDRPAPKPSQAEVPTCWVVAPVPALPHRSGVKADHQVPQGSRRSIPRTVSSKARTRLGLLECSTQDRPSSSHGGSVQESEQG